MCKNTSPRSVPKEKAINLFRMNSEIISFLTLLSVFLLLEKIDPKNGRKKKSGYWEMKPEKYWIQLVDTSRGSNIQIAYGSDWLLYFFANGILMSLSRDCENLFYSHWCGHHVNYLILCCYCWVCVTQYDFSTLLCYSHHDDDCVCVLHVNVDYPLNVSSTTNTTFNFPMKYFIYEFAKNFRG